MNSPRQLPLFEWSAPWQFGQPIRSEETTKQPLEKVWDVMGGPCFIAPKLDGFRLQVQRHEGRVWLFTRHGEDCTSKYSTIEAAARALACDGVVLEGELVPVNPRNDEVLPKDWLSRTNHLRLYVFDLLVKDGHEVMSEPLAKRIGALRDLIQRSPSRLIVPAQDEIVYSREELFRHHEQHLATGLEGSVVKSMYAAYKPGSRSHHRVKVKPVDTVDAVILGYDVKRSGNTITGATSYLVGVYDEESRIYVGIGKVPQGKLSLVARKTLYSTVSGRALSHRPGHVLAREQMDVWVQPVTVVEIDAFGRRPGHEYLAGRATLGIGYELYEGQLANREIRQDIGAEEATLTKFLEVDEAPGYQSLDKIFDGDSPSPARQLSLFDS